MTKKGAEFGWVIQPAPATAAGAATLNEDNLRFLNLIRSAFQTVWFEDHFLDVGRFGHDVRLEGWTLLTYLLPQFPELRFGNLVLGLAYRNPALVAKMAGTLQNLSGGRLISVSAPAGISRNDAVWWAPSPGVRVAQLEEYAHIIKLMLTQSPVSFSGKYYTVTNAPNDPLPAPPIPLMIGGSGEKGTLHYRKVCRLVELRAQARRGLRPQAGRLETALCRRRTRLQEITPSAFHFVNLSGQPSSSAVYTLGEDADTVTRQLEEFVALGARHFMLRFTDFPSTRGIEEFLEKVLPAFGDGSLSPPSVLHTVLIE